MRPLPAERVVGGCAPKPVRRGQRTTEARGFRVESEICLEKRSTSSGRAEGQWRTWAFPRRNTAGVCKGPRRQFDSARVRPQPFDLAASPPKRQHGRPATVRVLPQVPARPAGLRVHRGEPDCPALHDVRLPSVGFLISFGFPLPSLSLAEHYVSLCPGLSPIASIQALHRLGTSFSGAALTLISIKLQLQENSCGCDRQRARPEELAAEAQYLPGYPAEQRSQRQSVSRAAS